MLIVLPAMVYKENSEVPAGMFTEKVDVLDELKKDFVKGLIFADVVGDVPLDPK